MARRNARYLERLFESALSFIEKSPSHDSDHIRNVLGYARQLQGLYGGDLDRIEAAAIVHDLGRGADPAMYTEESRALSVSLARPLLLEAGFSCKDIELTLQIVVEHDQPGLKPSTLEGRVLKEADFLDGFGARGILRTISWTVEGGKGMAEILERLETKMPERISRLEFPESRRIAEQQYSLVRLFLRLLREQGRLEDYRWGGSYIVFEGISGTGKATQAGLLVEVLNNAGKNAVLVFEPSPNRGKKTLRQWREEIDDLDVEMFLFAADRVSIVRSQVLPPLREGKVVISVRSFLSSRVYQGTGALGEEFLAFVNSFAPRPDLVLWIDIPPELAGERIKERKGEPRSKFEAIGKFKLHRKRYRRMFAEMDNVVCIDGSGDIPTVHQKIISALTKRGFLKAA